jgi:hypothetical protein
VLIACGAPHAGTPPPDHVQAKRHCEPGQRNETADGYCFCDSYHGGVKPQPNVDYSRLVCVKTRHRSDGCPDDIKAGVACAGTPATCMIAEGGTCGPMLECKDGHWGGDRDTCAEIP